MLKSSPVIRKVIFFGISFAVIWPLIIFSAGPGLVYQLHKVNRICDHYESALFRAVYGLENLNEYAVVMGRKKFIKQVGSEIAISELREYTGKEEILLLETGSLKLPAIAAIIRYLRKRQVSQFVVESQVSVWTDFEPQNVNSQRYLDLLEGRFSIEKFYSILRAVTTVAGSSCEKVKKKLHPSLFDASYILDINGMETEAKRQIQEYNLTSPVTWIYDEKYFFSTLKGDAGTLQKLRELHVNTGSPYGAFVKLKGFVDSQ